MFRTQFSEWMGVRTMVGVAKPLGAVGVCLAVAVGIALGVRATGLQAQTGGRRTMSMSIVRAVQTCRGMGPNPSPIARWTMCQRLQSLATRFSSRTGAMGTGPDLFTRSGSPTAPITYKAIGNDVLIGRFEDVRDEDFQATQYPNVYAINKANASPRGYVVYQTFFDPIVVDDPNPTYFTMRPEDGPLAVNQVFDFETLTKIEGTWMPDAASGKIYVHPFGNRKPSTTNTDFVFGFEAGTLAMEAWVEFNIFDGFRLAYSGSDVFLILGKNNRFLNLKFQATTWQLRGSNNHAENITITHVIARGDTWEWHDSGEGTAMGVVGTGHRLRNIHVYHNWNSTVSQQNVSDTIIDGLRSHGAPNHCGASGSNTIVRNVVQYNCQDYFYWHQFENVVVEHAVVPTGIALEAITAPMGRITVRNSILGSGISFSSASKHITCAWEAGSIFENNIIPVGATILHCEDNKNYTFPDYVDKCASGVLKSCMTVRGIIQVTDFKTVIKDGLWTGARADNWDVSLVANSPAIDRAAASATATDLLGTPRPRGSAADIGVYEGCFSGCSTSGPTEVPQPTQIGAPANVRILP